MECKIQAEYHKATDILLHEPGNEMFYGLLHPETSCFLGAFDRFRAIDEHRGFRHALETSGIRVHYLKDLLLDGTLNDKGYAEPGPKLGKLQEIAAECLTYRFQDGLEQAKKDRIKGARSEVLTKMNPRDLVKIILERPTVNFSGNGDLPIPQLEPQANLLYMRDQQIVTSKGIVIGRMKEQVRQHEDRIISQMYNCIGWNPIYKVKAPDTLEGGDYIPAGEFALIGEGLRTTKGAIDQLLENDCFAIDEVVAVVDPYKQLEQMHLDTYFNIVGNQHAVILDERKKEHMRPTIRQYKRNSAGRFEQVPRDNNDFIQFITNEKGYRLDEVIYNCEKNFSVNILCVDNRRIIGVDGICNDSYKPLQQAGVDVRLLDFSNLIMAYGGPHCMTQVLRRVDNGKI